LTSLTPFVRPPHRSLSGKADDSGLAMAIVVGITAVLFVLCTMLLGLVVYQSTSSGREVARAKALHIADAGVNAYLYELRYDPDFYVTTPTLTARTEEGSWTVVASPPSATQPFLTLRSVGGLDGQESSRAVVATVRFPTFADYMFLEDCDIGIGSGATVNGKVHSNHDIQNSGTITGLATAYGTFRNLSGGRTLQGYLSTPAQVSLIKFEDVSATMDNIKAVAQGMGARAYAPAAPSGKQGYEIVVSRNTYTRRTVRGFTTSGYLIDSDAVTYTLPNAGVMYFDDDVWIRGDFGLSCTVVSSGSIYVVGNVRPYDTDSNTTIGLVGSNNVSVPGQYTVVPTDMVIQAALLAKSGSVTSTYGSSRKHSLTINGSLADKQVGAFSGAFTTRTYTYDVRLDLYPPPMYPRVRTDALKVQSWVER